VGFFSSVFLFSPSVVLLDFFHRVFWAFRNKGDFKTAIKKIEENFPQPPKKVLTYSRHFFFFFPGPPCAIQGKKTEHHPHHPRLKTRLKQI
jgi:hypothetical protein